ncbi:MAG: Maf family protein [Phycisphaerales bacterium]|nr:Maf family protein [Phycisphaerales bacterium]
MIEHIRTSRPPRPDPARDDTGLSDVVLILASRSPRRKQLLREHGYRVLPVDPWLNDGLLRMGCVSPAQWVAALAFLKASAGLRAVLADSTLAAAAAGETPGRLVILGADTTVVCDDRIIGQPTDADDARRILTMLSDRAHDVITGVALLDVTSDRRTFFHDQARVEVGPLTSEMIEAYIDSGQWQGKAGAYNLSERLDAGWPIRYEGDPGTIMGLPMRMLGPQLTWFCR